MLNFKSYLLAIFSLLFSSTVGSLFAQSDMKRVHYSVDEGLPNNAVSDILMDSRGYMWFATWDGLSRFDGFDFVNYKTGEDNSLSYFHNRISRIYEDKMGNIWLMMYDEKLFRLNRKSDRFESLIDRFPDSKERRIKNLLFASNGTVWAVADKHGVLDIQTEEATNNIEVHFHPLADVKVNQLYEDGSSTIWAATSKGLFVIKSAHSMPVSFCEEREILSCTYLDSCLFAGTNDGLLLKYDYTKELLTEIIVKQDEPISSITFDQKRGGLFLGTPNAGLFYYDIHTEQVEIAAANLREIECLYTDSEGLVWMFTNQPGVGMFNALTKKYIHFKQEVSIPAEYNPRGTIHEESGTIWVRMKGGGFGYYDRKKKRIDYFYNHPDTPDALSNIISAVKVSSPHMVWLSTSNRGVDQISIINKTCERKLLVESAHSVWQNEIRALHVGVDSILWVGTKSGILYGFTKEMQLLHHITGDSKGNSLGRIYAILQSKNGDLWIGTKGNGLFKIRETTQSIDNKLYNLDKRRSENTLRSAKTASDFHFEHYLNDANAPYSINSNEVYALLQDSKERIWIGTYGGGVNLLDSVEGKVCFLSAHNSFKSYHEFSSTYKVRTLIEDSEGKIWAGTTEGLVELSYQEECKELDIVLHRKGDNLTATPTSNDILSACRAKNGTLWFGTIGGGLINYRKESSTGEASFLSYTQKEGLPSNEVRGIAEDSEGTLWLTTENSICSFNPTNGIFAKLSVMEGIDYTLFSENAVAVMGDGKLFFGTANGYYVVDKSILGDAGEQGFMLQITDFQVNEESTSPRINAHFEKYVPECESVTLNDKNALFSFKFASLNYALQHRIRYQYILEGYDKEWINSSQERKATYVNLPAGSYLFKVKAFLPENPDKYEVKSIQLIVPLHFRESITAYFLYALVAILLLTTFFSIQYRRKWLLDKRRVLKIAPSEIAFRDDEDHQFVANLLAWLEKNYTNPAMKIEDMVASSGLGRTTFYNRLKTLTQMSPIEFVSDFRMKRAKMYLEKSSDTIAEIAYKTGFSDPVYFTRLFKAKYKETPTQFRKRCALVEHN